MGKKSLMKAGELERRFKAGEDAVALSVEKWERVCACPGPVFTCNIQGNACALCYQFFGEGEDGLCATCPLAIAGNDCNKIGSPWRAAQQELTGRARPGPACRRMLDTLRALVPEPGSPS